MIVQMEEGGSQWMWLDVGDKRLRLRKVDNGKLIDACKSTDF